MAPIKIFTSISVNIKQHLSSSIIMGGLKLKMGGSGHRRSVTQNSVFGKGSLKQTADKTIFEKIKIFKKNLKTEIF